MTVKEFKIQNALGTLSKLMKLKLANSPYTSKRILEILSKDKSLSIRYSVIRNFNVPTRILQKSVKEYFKE